MQEELFTLGGLDRYVPADHPLRGVREVFNGCLSCMDTHFDGLYSAFGRESIPPEKLLRALMLQVLFGIRSERQLVEQLRYNMLYRWFVGLPCMNAVGSLQFTKNRDACSEAVRLRCCSIKCSTVRAQTICCPTNTSRWTAP